MLGASLGFMHNLTFHFLKHNLVFNIDVGFIVLTIQYDYSKSFNQISAFI